MKSIKVELLNLLIKHLILIILLATYQIDLDMKISRINYLFVQINDQSDFLDFFNFVTS